MAFEFFTILLSNSLKKLRLPGKFATVFDGHEPFEVKLREAGRWHRLWDVEVVFDAEGHIYLGRVWEQFAGAHDLRLGHFLVLSYDGCHAMLTVKVFDGSMCRRHYQNDSDASSGSSGDSGNTLFLIMYMVRLLGQQGAEGEGQVPPQTEAEEGDGEQGISKMSNPCDSDGSQKGRSYCSEKLSAEDSLSVDNSVELANLQTLSSNYVLSTQCYLTKAQKVKIDALIEKIQPKFTVLVVQMKKSNVKRHATLIIHKDYALEHFPCVDTTVILQLPGKNKDWKCTFRIRPSGVSDAGRRNLFLYNFACDNHINEGDICLFQPMTNVKQKRFIVTVHVLHKANIDHSSGGRTDIGSNYGRKRAKMGAVKGKPHTDGKSHEVSEGSEGASGRLFMLSEKACLTPTQRKKLLKKVKKIKFKPPFYVAIMSKSTVCQRGSQNNPMLRFGSQYATRYLVEKFSGGHPCGKRRGVELVLLREGKSRSWPTKLRHSSQGSRVLKGWPSFARDNHLREGDLCLFKLLKCEELLTMWVYIVRR
ncbi:B3 domain-containing protein Os03g0620400-like [Triticum dicoccoides]|uniref:B3 domain-containing protein Os03g0620400-like n=1 Tax=Triticum dicoccoides TaxID=85692 RepID=UPI00188E74D8|nr:B3 domain-containing protein Os03g0620400-like [Triticum dicoccoides]